MVETIFFYLFRALRGVMEMTLHAMTSNFQCYFIFICEVVFQLKGHTRMMYYMVLGSVMVEKGQKKGKM